jgi:hypothetical protein
VVIFLWVQAAFWRQIQRIYTAYKTRNPLHFAIIIGVIGSMGNLLAHGLIDNSVYVQDLVYVFVFLLALAHNDANVSAIDEAP